MALRKLLVGVPAGFLLAGTESWRCFLHSTQSGSSEQFVGVNRVNEASLTVVLMFRQKNTVKTLFGGVITNNVVSLVSWKKINFLYISHDWCSLTQLWLNFFWKGEFFWISLDIFQLLNKPNLDFQVLKRLFMFSFFFMEKRIQTFFLYLYSRNPLSLLFIFCSLKSSLNPKHWSHPAKITAFRFFSPKYLQTFTSLG